MTEPEPETEPPLDTPGPWWALAVGPLDTMPHPRTAPRFGPVVSIAAGLTWLTDAVWDYYQLGSTP